MAKQKLTRKSYKRNIVVFGIMLFMGIALVSTGFATWVLSQDVTATHTGNVEIGVVDDKGLKIEDLKYYWYDQATSEYVALEEGNFSYEFEPNYDDNSGAVRWNKTDYEKLALKITGKVNIMNEVDEFLISMVIPEEVKALADPNNDGDFSDGLIVLPKFAEAVAEGEEGHKIYTNNKSTDIVVGQETVGKIDAQTGVFEIIVAFKWGEAFNGKNPSEYYDTEFTLTDEQKEAGETVNSIAKKVLQNLRCAVHGCTYVTGADNVDYEIYNVGEQKLALKDGKYYVFEIDENNNVTLGAEEEDPAIEKPQFSITINVTAK